MTTRRELLKYGFAGLIASCIPTGSAYAKLRFLPERSLSFFNLHTNESLADITYWRFGSYIPGALQDINFLLRDFRTNDVLTMDPRLMDILYVIQESLETKEPFQIISGYRSPKTNAMLRSHSDGVASGSLHTKGKAVDINLDSIPLSKLHEVAVNLRAGGVGYYPGSNFVHVDTGKVRYW